MTDYFGVSVRGPEHRRQRLPNQDSWIGRKGRFGSAVVVCDGVGSKPHSALGSQMACLAAMDAVKKWSEVPAAPLRYLPYLIEVLWRMRIAPLPPTECATTCLLAVRYVNGNWIVGGIGDGLAILRTGEQEIRWVIGNGRSGFSNEVSAMGFERKASDWRLHTFEEDPKGCAAILATDGISDDLVESKTGDFISWLLSRHGEQPRSRLVKKLRTELNNWPTNKHSDDKTLAVLVSGGTGDSE